MTTPTPTSAPGMYSERRLGRNACSLYARDYSGAGPAFLLMHGFPDNLRIYDALAGRLAGAGRRAVAFDFLGFGGSDKPADYPYAPADLEKDLQAVVDALDLAADHARRTRRFRSGGNQLGTGPS